LRIRSVVRCIFASGQILHALLAEHLTRLEVALLNKLVFENLRQRPVRTWLSVLAIGVEVTMILTLLEIRYGTLHEAARVPAESERSEKLVPFLMRQPISHSLLAPSRAP
jgi:hypothetical protein